MNEMILIYNYMGEYLGEQIKKRIGTFTSFPCSHLFLCLFFVVTVLSAEHIVNVAVASSMSPIVLLLDRALLTLLGVLASIGLRMDILTGGGQWSHKNIGSHNTSFYSTNTLIIGYWQTTCPYLRLAVPTTLLAFLSALNNLYVGVCTLY